MVNKLGGLVILLPRRTLPSGRCSNNRKPRPHNNRKKRRFLDFKLQCKGLTHCRIGAYSRYHGNSYVKSHYQGSWSSQQRSFIREQSHHTDKPSVQQYRIHMWWRNNISFYFSISNFMRWFCNILIQGVRWYSNFLSISRGLCYSFSRLKEGVGRVYSPLKSGVRRANLFLNKFAWWFHTKSSKFIIQYTWTTLRCDDCSQ